MRLASFIPWNSVPLFLAISFSLPNPCAPEPKQSDQPEEMSPDEPTYEVSVVYPRFREAARVVDGKGKFTVSERLSLKLQEEGVIEKIYVSEGDHLVSSDPLCLIKGDELNQEIERKQAELKEAEAQVELARKRIAGNPTGLEEGQPEPRGETPFLDEEEAEAPPPYKVNEPASPEPPPAERSPWDLPDVASKLKLAEARIERLNTELDQLEEKLKNLTVKAPIAGMIQKKHVAEGSFFNAEDPLFDIVTIDPITLTVRLPQQVASYVDKQSSVKGYPLFAPEKVVEGSIFYISPEIDPISHSLEVRIHFPNEGGVIKEGEEGKAIVSTRKMEKVLVVPRKALVEKEGKTFIYVVLRGKALLTEVSPGQLLESDEIEIEANIRVDDPIVTSGSERLQNGSRVSMMDEPSPPPPLSFTQ